MHDMDLYMLYCNKGFAFSRILKAVLISFANDKEYKILMPDGPDPDITKKKFVIQNSFTLDANKEEENKAIILLNRIRPNQKNSFLKNLIRRYISSDIMKKYLVGDSDYKVTCKNESKPALKPFADKKEEKIIENVPIKKEVDNVKIEPEPLIAPQTPVNSAQNTVKMKTSEDDEAYDFVDEY